MCEQDLFKNASKSVLAISWYESITSKLPLWCC